MAIRDVTQQASVRRAIAEFNALGREDFLSKYGFGPAQTYFLIDDGQKYDSKAILGAAHGYEFGQPLTAKDFSGGEATVKRKLEALGFKVDRLDAAAKRNPPWQRDELILALDLYFKYPPNSISKNHPAVVELSEVLNRLPIHEDRPDQDRFRNPNGVYMKMCNFLPLDPSYSGKGLEAGGALDRVVWSEFSGDRERLAAVAQSIRDSVTSLPLDVPAGEDDEAEFPEGKVMYRLHRSRERSRELVRRAKDQALKKHGKLTCEACGFDFQTVYGDVGKDFIECHHNRPISEADEEQKSRVADLSLLCSNCHRMIHRRRPWLSVEELRRYLIKEPN